MGQASAETTLSKRPRKSRDLGPLHDLIKNGLPEFVDANGTLDVRKLAMEFGISYQAVYLMFQRGSISKKRIAQVCLLSKRTKPSNRPSWKCEVEWKPLVVDDFWPFMA